MNTPLALLYNSIGSGYNYTRKADPYISERLTHLLCPQKKSYYLDIGCGTGNYTIALSEKGLPFYGIDPSDKMLKEARFKSQKVKWLKGAAQSISIENNFFSGAIATLTIHHWDDFATCFSEINRVLKPKGKFIIFTAMPEQMQNYWLLHYFPEMMDRSIKRMPSLELIRRTIRETGFKLLKVEKYTIHDDLSDLFLYSGKNNPAIYFDESVRNGISSFANLCEKNELQKGLIDLAYDLINENFTSIRKNYDNNASDYIFLVLEKIGDHS